MLAAMVLAPRLGLLALLGLSVLPAVEHRFRAGLDLHTVAPAESNNAAVDHGSEVAHRSFAGDVGWRATFAEREIEGAPVAMPLVWWEQRLGYQRLRIDYELDADTDAVEDFTGIGYRSLFSHRFHDDWSYTLLAGAKLTVDDLGEADGGDVQYSGGLQVAWHWGRETTIGLGVFYQQLLGESRVLPFPFLRYVGDERRHSVSIMGPRFDYRYGFTRAHSLGAFVQLSGERLLIVSERFRNHDRDGRLVEAEEAAALALSEWIAGLRYGFRVDRRWQFATEAGWVFARRFELVTRDDGEAIRLGDGTAVDFDPEASWSLRVSGGIRF